MVKIKKQYIMKINILVSIIVIIFIIIAGVLFGINNKDRPTNKEITQSLIDTLEFCGIIEKVEYRIEGSGSPYFMIDGNWHYVGFRGGINYFEGDSVCKEAGSNLIKIYHVRDDWEEEIVEL